MANGQPVRVMVVDDSAIVRGLITKVLESDPALPITYPAYGSSTSLHHDALLEDGETDVVRFFVDTSGASAGDYTMTVLASYARGGDSGGVKGAVTVSVVP